MASILGTDSTFALPNFTLVTASAGAGKTHTLTLRYLQILLSPRIPQNHPKNILAITFTNNAAVEMKERILLYLKYAHLGVSNPAVDELKRIVPLDDELFRRRAGECLMFILDHYSDFQVQTIDSFIVRLLKVSAVEHGFTPQFDVSFDFSDLLEKALDSLSRTSAYDATLMKLFEDVVRLVEETRPPDGKYLWNPYTLLSREFQKVAERLITHRGEPLYEDWGEKKGVSRQNVIAHFNAIDDIVRKTGFNYSKSFERLVQSGKEGTIDDVLGKKISQKPLLKSTDSAYQSATEDITKIQKEIERELALYVEAKSRTYYQPYIALQTILKESIHGILKRSGKAQLAMITRMLANRISGEDIPELYFTLGERIHHYLIDEFQDTSPVQWSVLRPLIENSLAQQGSLFAVGDTKQSIYTFRGADWRIMAGMMEHEEFPSARCERKVLPVNWRSSEAVVRFVNHVFDEIVPSTDAADAALLSGLTSSQQGIRPGAEGTGFVTVKIFEPEEEAPEIEHEESPERQHLIEVLSDCHTRGYSYSDLAILTPRNNNVITVSRWLNKADIPFMSYSSLDIRTRTITGELIALLRFLYSPVDDLAFSSFVLGSLYRSVMGQDPRADEFRSFIIECRAGLEADAPLYTMFRKQFPDLWNRHFEELFTRVGFLPVYDLVAAVYATFDVFGHCQREEATVVKFLDVIKTFEERGTNSLKDFLSFSLEKEEEGIWNMDRTASADAVTIMTVHKAKGLGFPVVIALFYDSPGHADPLVIEEEGESVRVLRTTKEWAELSPALEPIYREEKRRRKADDLNSLYVALTRAKEELHIVGVKRNRGKEPSIYLPPDGYTLGTPLAKQPETLACETEAPLLHHTRIGMVGSAGAALHSKEEIQRGEFIHAVLSKISFVDESIDGIVSHLVEETADIQPMPRDGESLKELLQNFLTNEAILPYFEHKQGRSVLTETEVVGMDGRLRRIDRLVIDSDAVTIIDFKTGEEHANHRDQLLDYSRTIQPLHQGKTIYAVLAYIDMIQVRMVV